MSGYKAILNMYSFWENIGLLIKKCGAFLMMIRISLSIVINTIYIKQADKVITLAEESYTNNIDKVEYLRRKGGVSFLLPLSFFH